MNDNSVSDKYIDLVNNKPYLTLVRNTKIKYNIFITFQIMIVILSIYLCIACSTGSLVDMSSGMKAFLIIFSLGFFAFFFAIEEFVIAMALPFMIFTIVLLIVLFLRKNYLLMCYQDAFIKVFGEDKLNDEIFLNNQVISDR